MALVGGTGLIIYYSNGFPSRKNASLINEFDGDIGHLEYHRFIANKYFPCTPKSVANAADKWDGFIRCIQSKPEANIDIAIVGDSHAEHLFLGIAEALPNKNVVFYTKGGLPFIGNSDFKDIFDAIIASKSITQVIVSALWIERYTAIAANSSLDKELIAVIDALSKSGKSVSLTEDVPTFPFRPILCKGTRWPLSTQGKKCDMAADKFLEQKQSYYPAFDKVIKQRPSTKIIKVSDYLCDANICSMAKNNSVLYRDPNHLNLIGSSYVGRRIVEDNPDIFIAPK